MISLLAAQHNQVTGRALARALGAAALQPQDTRTDLLVRWGCVTGPDLEHTLNKRQGITNAVDKFHSFELLRDAGVRIPHFHREPSFIQEELGYPVLGRLNDHTGGKDIVLCLQKKDWEENPRDFYVEYIPKAREYRIHIFDGKPVYTQLKALRDPEAHRRKPWAWNHGAGFVFVQPERKLRSSRYDAAIAAVAALGLDFGAVDLIIGENDSEYVLEVNTAPGLAPRGARIYVDCFAERARSLGLPVRLDYTALDALATNNDLEN